MTIDIYIYIQKRCSISVGIGSDTSLLNQKQGLKNLVLTKITGTSYHLSSCDLSPPDPQQSVLSDIAIITRKFNCPIVATFDG